MARVNVTVQVDRAALQGFLANEVASRFQQAAGTVRDLAKAEITAAGRVDTGQMRNANVAETAQVRGSEIAVRVVNDTPQAGYQHEGTARVIRPRRARVLRFRPRGGAFVFAPEVQGIWPGNRTEPLPFLTNALDKLNIDDFT